MARFYMAAMLALAAAATVQGQRLPARGKVMRPRVPAHTPIDRWNQMTPSERQNALQKLTPERQKQIEERLKQYNSLPKEERDRLRERYDQFSHLTPVKQDLVRRQMKRFAEVPTERRRILSRELVRLRKASDEDRRSRINSEEFRSRYTLQEQQMLQDLSENLVIRPQVAEASNFTGK